MKLYCVDSFDAASWSNHVAPARGARPRSTGATSRGSSTRSCRASTPTAAAAGHRHARRQPRRLPRRQLRAQARRPVPARDLPVGQLRPGDAGTAGASAARPPTSTTRSTTSATCGGDHLDWLRSRLSLLLVCGQGQWEDTTGSLECTKRLAGLLGEKGIRHELDLWGHDVPHDWPSWRAQLAHHLPTVLLMRRRHAPDRAAARHRGGLAARVRDAARAARPDQGRERHDAPRHHRADHDRAVRPARQAALRPRHRPARLLVLPPARVAEEGRADGRRVPAQQPVHVPVDGEARGLLRDDAARAEGARRPCSSRTRTRPTTRASPTPRRSTTSRSTSTRSPRRSATRCS